jgi:hypothetical protein
MENNVNFSWPLKDGKQIYWAVSVKCVDKNTGFNVVVVDFSNVFTNKHCSTFTSLLTKIGLAQI